MPDEKTIQAWKCAFLNVIKKKGAFYSVALGSRNYFCSCFFFHLDRTNVKCGLNIKAASQKCVLDHIDINYFRFTLQANKLITWDEYWPHFGFNLKFIPLSNTNKLQYMPAKMSEKNKEDCGIIAASPHHAIFQCKCPSVTMIIYIFKHLSLFYHSFSMVASLMLPLVTSATSIHASFVCGVHCCSCSSRGQ